MGLCLYIHSKIYIPQPDTLSTVNTRPVWYLHCNQSKGKEVKFDLNTYVNMGLSRVEAESFIACLKTQEFLSNKMLSTNKPTENGGHQ